MHPAKSIAVLAAAAGLALGASACGGSGGGSSTGASGSGGSATKPEKITKKPGEPTIGFAEINLSLPFFVDMRKASETLARQYGVNAVWQSADGSLSNEISTVQNYIAQKVDAIAIDPINAKGLVSVVNQATSAGIPVVTMGNVVPAKGNVNTLYPDYDDWVTNAKILGNAVHGKGTVLLLIGSVGNYVSDTRQRAFMKTMKQEFPGVKVVVEPTNFDSSKAASVTQSVLTNTPDLAGVASISDGLTLPALKVLQARGKLGIPVVTNDGDPGVVPYIEKGQVLSDILTGDLRVGAWNTAVAARLAKGHKFPTNVYMHVYFVMTAQERQKLAAQGIKPDSIEPSQAAQTNGAYAHEFGASKSDKAINAKP